MAWELMLGSLLEKHLKIKSSGGTAWEGNFYTNDFNERMLSGETCKEVREAE